MVVFYRIDGDAPRGAPELPAGVRARLWRPSWLRVPPAAIRDAKHWVWWLFHNLRLFANRDFAVVMLERDGRLLHRSGVFPGFFRFPFMGRDDLQVGDTWTDPAARGQGLAGQAIAVARAQLGRPGRRFWYLTDSDNLPSIRVVEKQGFRFVSPGERRPRAGLAALGYYTPTPAPARADASPSPIGAP